MFRKTKDLDVNQLDDAYKNLMASVLMNPTP